MTLIITAAELKSLYPRCAYDYNELATALSRDVLDFGLTDSVAWSQFVAQLAHESQNFMRSRENLHYSAARLHAVFPYVSAAKAQQIAGDEVATAEAIYGLGNPRKAHELGNIHPGDGYKFRGGGPLQLTGGTNFKQAGEGISVDLYNNPDLIAKAKTAIRACAWWFKNRGCLGPAERDDTQTVTREVNGPAMLGLAERRQQLIRLRRKIPLSVIEDRMKGAIAEKAKRTDDGLDHTDVKTIQTKLTAKRFFAGGVDGDMGPETRSAIRDFQDANGLPVTGAPDQKTVVALHDPETPDRPIRQVSFADLSDGGSVQVKHGTRVAMGGGAVALLSSLQGLDVAGSLDAINSISDKANMLKDVVHQTAELAHWAQNNWWIIAALIGGFVAKSGIAVVRQRIQEAKTGENQKI